MFQMDVIDDNRPLPHVDPSGPKIKSEIPQPKASLAIKIVFFSICMIIQLLVIYARVRQQVSGPWGTIFIPSFLMIGTVLMYIILHWRYYERIEGSASRAFLSISWKLTVIVVTLVFLIMLSIQLDRGEVDADADLLLWVSGASFCLVLVAFYVIVNYCC